MVAQGGVGSVDEFDRPCQIRPARMTSASASPRASTLEQLLDAARGRDLDVAVMVSSVDGIVAIDGRVGALTSEADQRLLLGMRERAIAVVAGAATVRAEGYGGLLPTAAQQRRVAAGLRAQPELVAISHSADGVAGTPAAHTHDLDLRVEQPPPADDGGPDLQAASAAIRDRHGPGLVVWEGGPTLVRTAITQGVLGELFPLAGPETSGLRRLQLLGTAVSGGFLFLRYGLGPLSQ
jgi:riboflavin biosynthesis pyrimidine reductase